MITLSEGHERRYVADGRPGDAKLPLGWRRRYDLRGVRPKVRCVDQQMFDGWGAAVHPVYRAGCLNLTRLRPLVRVEFKWALHAHSQHQHQRGRRWLIPELQTLANRCQDRSVNSLVELDLDHDRAGREFTRLVARMRDELKLVYVCPAETRDAGYVAPEQFGIRFKYRQRDFDLTRVPQRWLRDLLWDYFVSLLRSPQCPRSAGVFEELRRAGVELGAFLESDAPAAGHDPSLVGEEHAHRFVADLRHRERHGMPSRVPPLGGRRQVAVTEEVRRRALNGTRRVLRWALESGAADRIGLAPAFVAAIPAGGPDTKPSRRPFPDDVAKALADESNLRRLAAEHDPHDRGLRDIWEAIVYTGRRSSEVIELRLDCTGRYGGVPLLWHDQTKVGNLDVAIRIPERLLEVIQTRQAKTLARFTARNEREPRSDERVGMALFPSPTCNPFWSKPMSYTWFSSNLRQWIGSLDIGTWVAHQARHTLATNLFRHGASLAHIRRYLGHISDRMAEHYTKVATSEIEDVLQAVWVAGPGTASPGELLSGSTQPLSRAEALALAVDLSRRSTPTEGGFCTFQPVVDGGACPWNLDCHNCDRFVLSGADLLYWKRKQQQWRSIAERAPDSATADYLHDVFEPTARAISGLEKALAGLGLLDEALGLDLRRPQDYFERVWSVGFRATELARAAGHLADGAPTGSPRG